MRKLISSVDELDGLNHTYFIQKSDYTGVSVYVQYLGGGSHLINNVNSVKSIIHSLGKVAIRNISTVRQPISAYTLTNGTGIISVNGVISRINELKPLEQIFEERNVELIWGIKTLK